MLHAHIRMYVYLSAESCLLMGSCGCWQATGWVHFQYGSYCASTVAFSTAYGMYSYVCMCGIPPLWFYLGFKHFHLTAAILQRKAFANAASCVVDLKVIMQFNISTLQYEIFL